MNKWSPVFQINDGAILERGAVDIRAFQLTFGTLSVIGTTSSASQLFSDNDIVTNREYYSYAMTWDNGTVVSYKNGTSLGSTSAHPMQGTFDTICIGTADFNGRALDGWIKKLAVYPKSLSSATIQAISEE